ncbi:MAG: ABC transporter substrate-binding protein [Candidatus Binatia bacterium]
MLLERRAFMAFLGCAVVSRPIPALAQQATRPRTVGVLIGLSNDAETQARAKAFEQGLEKEGWSIGKDLLIEYRFSGGDFTRMHAFANEFVELKPDCILGHSTPVVKALMQATQTIPIVFVSVTDPIGSKFVASMARPGGNATGFTILQATITGKYLSILRELVPQVARVAIIYNPDSAPGAGTFFLQPFIEAARELKIEPITGHVYNPAEIESFIAQLAGKPDVGLIVMPDNFTTLHRELFIKLAARYRIPTIYPYRYFAEAGGLLSYGVDAVDLFKRASVYVSRILRGANPADLPVQAPTEFELVINLKTAKELGLAVPRVLLAGADHLIE